jgi:hypothetical protein
MVKHLLSILLISCSFSVLYSQTYTINSGGTVSTCSGNFYDSGGSGGKYAGNEDYTMTFCSSDPAKCIKLTFNSFQTEKDADTLVVYNGPTAASPSLGTFSNNVGPGVVTSVPGGCLTFRFKSNNTTHRNGWEASISCDCSKPNTDCVNKKPICNDATLNDNNNGKGSVTDLNAGNQDCLASGENQTSWYYVKFTSSGTFNFKIIPTNGTDDYDFAIYGPNPNCPPTTLPTRCSYCPPPYGVPLDYSTGLKAGGGGTSEGSLACDGWLNEMNVVTGEIYIIVIDNFSGTNSGFTLDLGGTAGRDCAITVPVELFTFYVKDASGKAFLEWKTASEVNTDHFAVERSEDGINFEQAGSVAAAGLSTDLRKYSYTDEKTPSGGAYYRLRQVDTDGSQSYSQIISYKGRLVLKPIVINNGNTVVLKSLSSGYIPGAFASLFDITGARVSESRCELSPEGFLIDIANLSRGVYFIRISAPGVEDVSLKIVK